jgi:hypothetical protein
MGMWILEGTDLPKYRPSGRESLIDGFDIDRAMEHVPGTTRYFDDPERPQAATADHAGLKCDTSGPVPIILVPQPSDDPNDPLVRHLMPYTSEK